jgi:hypothetical protein
MPARGLSRPMFGFAMVIVMVLSVAILTDRTKDTTVPGGGTAKKEPTVPGRGTAKKDTTPTVTPVSGRYTVPGDTAPKLGSPKPNIPPSPVAAQFVYAPKAGVALSLVLPDSISSHAKCVRADLQVTFRHAESGVLLGEPLHVLCDETQAFLLTDESLAEAQLPQDTCLKAEVGPANHRPLATGMIQLRSDNEYNKSRPRITACLPS